MRARSAVAMRCCCSLSAPGSPMPVRSSGFHSFCFVQPTSTGGHMTQQEILAGLAEIVNEIAGIPVEDVEIDKSFIDDLDLDSLTMVEVATSAEDKFGVRIPDENLKDLKTVRDAVDFIEKAGVAA